MCGFTFSDSGRFRKQFTQFICKSQSACKTAFHFILGVGGRVWDHLATAACMVYNNNYNISLLPVHFYDRFLLLCSVGGIQASAQACTCTLLDNIRLQNMGKNV